MDAQQVNALESHDHMVQWQGHISRTYSLLRVVCS